MIRPIDISGMVPEARPIVQEAAAVYLKYTQPWFVGLIAHGSAVKGGFIPGCSDIDFQLYLTQMLTPKLDNCRYQLC